MAVTMNKKDEMIMRLVHYFITEENYSPIVVSGIKDEVWLQNQNGPYKIIRINANYIHNDEQYDFDLMKLKNVMWQVKRKTLSWSVNALNILLDINETVKISDAKNINSVHLTERKKIEEKNILETFPEINQKILANEKGLDLMIDVTNDINEKTEKENKIYESIFKPKKIVVTNLLVFLNVIIFFCLFAYSRANITSLSLLNFGGNFSYLVQMGQVWRLVTSGFLHSGLFHLLFNMYALYLIGIQVENFVGKWKFLTIYFFSMITASMMSCILNPGVVSVGASGAIFGLLGALVYFGFHYRLYLGSVLRNQIIPVILINLVMGFLLPGVDNAAHIGGLIGGLFIAMALGVQKTEEKQTKINGLIASLIFIAFLGYLLFFR